MMSGSVPPRFNHLFGHSISTSHRDVTEDKYRELRRPRKVTFFCNGDRYFKGKKLSITPHRYLTFNDLLNDLTGKLPTGVGLPYGVRQIYTPVAGKRIKDIEELQDRESYVCAGFEPFKSIRYGGEVIDRWSMGRPVQNDFQQSLSPNFSNQRGGYNSGYGGFGGFHPGRHLRQTYPRGRYQPGNMGPGAYQSQLHMPNDHIPMKPKVITVVRNGKKPRNNIKILLNKRSLQSFEQLMADISEAFGPKWKNNKVRSLYTTRGKGVNGISDFFRNEDIFVAVGNEPLTNGDVQDIIEELYPEGTDTQHILKEWEKNKKKNKPMYMYTYGDKDNDPKEESKRDSGFEDTGSSGDPKPDKDEIIYEGLTPRSWKSRSRKPPYSQYPEDEDWIVRKERERARAAERERELARRKMQKKLEAERQALEDEKRKRGLVLQKDNDKLKKRQQEKMKERKRKEAEMQRAKDEDEKARREEEEKAIRAATKKMGKKKDDDEVEQVEIIITKGANQTPKKEPKKKKVPTATLR